MRSGPLAACGEVTNPGDDDDDDDDDTMVADASPDATSDADVPADAAEVTGVDLLFVIDKSNSMQEEQPALTDAFPQLVAALDNASGGLPSLHVGVISTDVGAGPFRCFEFGVVCEPDDPRTPGVKSNCAPREDSQYMFPVSAYIDFLHGVHPGRLLVATIAGNADPVEVATASEGAARELEPSCTSSAGEAAPGVRIEAFAAGFPGASYRDTICGGIGDGLVAIAAAIGDRL